MHQVERWSVFEWSGKGKTAGNPFTDYEIFGLFRGPAGEKKVSGFYDGDGVYRVRFMPEIEGEYTFEIFGSFSDEIQKGAFVCIPAAEGNHGPVRARGFHFEYDDGTAYYPLGTTCYVWNLQKEELRNATLAELKKGYFNKIRFCVWPKHYLYNLHEPVTYPYEGTPVKLNWVNDGGYPPMGNLPGNDWDFTRFNPQHFRGVEKCIAQLGEIGVEADLIVMHPYDRWGFSCMTKEQDDLYWKYVLARFSAYRNVWWSLANEYDLLREKTVADWERFGKLIVENDPYGHLRSIHNCTVVYDHSRPWITHCSIQRTDTYKTTELVDQYRVRYGKPVIMDEICYEGDIDQGWGNISGQELVRRYWEAALRGGYATHGETFVGHDDILWWSHGGALHGESPARIRFLGEILKQTPGAGLRILENRSWDEVAACSDGMMGDGGYSLYYYGLNRPSSRLFRKNPGEKFHVEVIDTWNMTVEDRGVQEGTFRIALPGREYMAIRLRRV